MDPKENSERMVCALSTKFRTYLNSLVDGKGMNFLQVLCGEWFDFEGRFSNDQPNSFRYVFNSIGEGDDVFESSPQVPLERRFQ